MEDPLREKLKRDELQRLMGEHAGASYPIAARAVNKKFVMRDLNAVDGNELRYFSRKPLALNKEKRDDMNKDFIRHPFWEDPNHASLNPPLRGYLARDDFEELQHAREFLYGEYRVDKLEQEIMLGRAQPGPEGIGKLGPGKKKVARIMQ